MKLTKQLLKEMIIKEVKEKLLTEEHISKYKKIIKILRDAPYKSLAIMSGQNPGASSSDASTPLGIKTRNARLKKSLEQRLKEEGLPFKRVGGNFYGLDEQSVLVYNEDPSADAHDQFLHKIAALNREFGQWGFLAGDRITDPDNPAMGFTLYKIDYSVNHDRAYGAVGPVPTTTTVYDDDQIKQMKMTGDHSYDPTSGKKWIIPV
tara:strand:+ start:1170 stop:1787 length:618 start_codon:yes stop_codon:yes gene_type:complete